MQGQHETLLDSFYKKAIQKTRQYLESKYPLVICNQDDEDIAEIAQILSQTDPPYKEFWKIEISGSFRRFTLILSIPDTFPDLFPKIYLTKKEYQEVYPIPHLDKNRFVCTRDPEVSVLNDKKPEEAVEELIQIAVGILETGLKKENQSDFIEEFLAYWNDKATPILSLFIPTDDVIYLQVFKLSKKIFGSEYILCDSKEKLQEWLKPFRVDILEEENAKVLYLPLVELFFPHQLEKEEDIIDIFKNSNNKKYIKAIENYLNQDRDYYIVIASFSIRGERILFGWRHQGWRGIEFRGFRKNHVPLNVRLKHQRTKSNLLQKISIIRLDKERIFKRGSTMTKFLDKNISIAIIGCGSLGSYLAMSLSRCGISKYLFIDKERLEPENTPRHLCGFVEASQRMKKVDALKKKLMGHFPHIECNTYGGDVLSWLQKETNSLKEYDLTVVAIGNMGVERRINYLLRHGAINKPVIFLWIEPFGVGGHVLCIHPENGGCYNCCFDNEGNFLYSITSTRSEDRDKFKRRESGCQSTFTPYSSLHIEQFISIACKKILDILEKDIDTSVLYTWLGDIEEFERLGFNINPIYDAQLSYRIIERKIIQQKWCGICKKNE